MSFEEWCIEQFKKLNVSIPLDQTEWMSTLEDMLDTDIATLVAIDGVDIYND